MPELTKTRPIKKRGPYTSHEKDWRTFFKKDFQERGEVGVYLRGLRIRERMTQAQLAKKLGKGVSQHHISEMENGKRSISKEMAKRLGEVLHSDYRMFL